MRFYLHSSPVDVAFFRRPASPANLVRQRGGGEAVLLILDRDVIPPNAQYCDADVAYALACLSRERFISRSDLRDYLGIGEGSVRALLKIMVDYGMVTISRRGVSISDNGRTIYFKMGIRPIEIKLGYHLGRYTQAIKVMGVAEKITTGMNQVKISTANGGLGCTTWVMKNKTLYMPPHLKFSEESVMESEKIIDTADLHNGDVFLICGAESLRNARVAAMMVALDLV